MDKNLINDVLYYCHPQVTTDTWAGRYVITGLVAGIMATTGHTFEETMKHVKTAFNARHETSDLTEEMVMVQLPENWAETWKKA